MDEGGRHDRARPSRARPGSDDEEGPPRVKVTDKRRVQLATRLRRPEPCREPARRWSGPGRRRHRQPGGHCEAPARRRAEYLDHLQRLQAEFDNYRKRVLREQTRAVELAAEPLVRRLLEVLDEFDLALMAAEQQPEFEQFLQGVELVYAKLQDILRSEGLERIEARGQAVRPRAPRGARCRAGGRGRRRAASSSTSSARATRSRAGSSGRRA